MFRRQIDVIGKENQDILNHKSVLIVGCGGLGNIIATTLSCIGLKRIYLVDFDVVEEHNIHRQFQFSLNSVGKSKSEELKNKISRCNTDIIAINQTFKSDIDINVDIVFDATDNFDVRFEIDKFAKRKSIPWIYASVEEYVGQVGIFISSSFDIFASKEIPSKGQLPPMVNLVGSLSSMLGLKVLLGYQKEILYFLDFNEDLEIKKFYL